MSLGPTTPINPSIGRSYPSRRHRTPHCALPGSDSNLMNASILCAGDREKLDLVAGHRRPSGRSEAQCVRQSARMSLLEGKQECLSSKVRQTQSSTPNHTSAPGSGRHELTRPAEPRHARACGPRRRPRRHGQGSGRQRRLAPAGGKTGDVGAITASSTPFAFKVDCCIVARHVQPLQPDQGPIGDPRSYRGRS